MRQDERIKASELEQEKLMAELHRQKEEQTEMLRTHEQDLKKHQTEMLEVSGTIF